MVSVLGTQPGLARHKKGRTALGQQREDRGPRDLVSEDEEASSSALRIRFVLLPVVVLLVLSIWARGASLQATSVAAGGAPPAPSTTAVIASTVTTSTTIGGLSTTVAPTTT